MTRSPFYSPTRSRQAGALPVLRWMSLAALLGCTLVAEVAHASSYTGSFPRAQSPNTYARPNAYCNRATDVVRSFEVFSFALPTSGAFTLTVTRTDGKSGLAGTVHQNNFMASEPCMNWWEGKQTTGNSLSFTINTNFPAYAYPAAFDLIIAGANGSDSGTFRVDVSGPAPLQIRCPNTRLSPDWADVEASGGSFTATFSPSGIGCTDWTSADVPAWISGIPSSGSGPATFSYTVAPNTDTSPRDACPRIGSTHLCVFQEAAEACSYSLANGSANAGAAGGPANFALNASSAACAWTAAGNAPWITNVTASGTGSGPVSYSVAANAGPARTGTITAAAQTFTVTQADGCTFSLSSPSDTAGSTGGAKTLSIVASDGGCAWSASSNVSWITGVTASGTGNGNVTYTVAANAGPERTGTLTLAGQTFTVTQASGCTYSLSPTSAQAGAAGGNLGTTLTASDPACAWTATSGASWVSGLPASGSGSAPVGFSVAANPGPARMATLSIAGQSFEVTQADGCTYSLSATSHNAVAQGESLSVGVTASHPGCAWSATSQAGWLTGVSPSSGSGDGTVQLTVSANSAPQREGTLTIAGSAFVVTQAGGCTTTLAQSQATVDPIDAAHSFDVTVSDVSCPWTALTTSFWVSNLTASGTGSGAVQFEAAASTTPERTAQILVNDQTYTLIQRSGCSVSLSSAQGSTQAEGGASSFAVTSGAGCEWVASTIATWLTQVTVTEGGVSFVADAWDGAARSATITVESTTTDSAADYTVSQAAGCVVTLPNSIEGIGAEGVSSSFEVTTAASCTWTAAAQDGWLEDVEVTETGVAYQAAANTGPARTGTIQVVSPETNDTKTFEVRQASGCLLSLESTEAQVGIDGGQVRFDFSMGEGCTAVAVATTPWLTDLAVGTTELTLTVPANDGPARTADLLLATADENAQVMLQVIQEGPITHPVIVRQPAALLLMEQETAVLTVEAVGGNLQYQWRHRGTDLPGATGATHRIPDVRQRNAGTYDVVIWNEVGSVTSEGARLQVTSPEVAPPEARTAGCSAAGTSLMPGLTLLCAAGLTALRRRRRNTSGVESHSRGS